jgi:dTDP-L-rhamnose 4-epimerase
VQVLITGGAGFIGSHLTDDLLQAGHAVRILDNLDPQVHGAERTRPAYLNPAAELVVGDVRDREVVGRALGGADAVVHLAARVGVGQSMYEVQDYVDVNERGTAVLLQALIEKPVGKLVVASSMSIYGEGLTRDGSGRLREDANRTPEQLRGGRWEPEDEIGRRLRPLATPETKRPSLASVYALGKYSQERMCLLAGQAYDIDTVALRFFNVYGTRQALSNPYTGVLAIFASRLLNRRTPLIFEDGRQRRDFVHVRDVARACRLALAPGAATGHAVNVGSGTSITISAVAERLARTMGIDVPAEITGRYRVGDIRHCFADPAQAKALLGFEAEIGFDDGLAELVEWLAGEVAIDRVEAAQDELARRGLAA